MPVRRVLTSLAALLAIVCAIAIFPGCGKSEPEPDNKPKTTLDITTGGVIPDGKIGVAYMGAAGLQFVATGGVPPYTWALVSGGLPPSMNFGPGGTLSGAPSATGTYIFTVEVFDSLGFSVKRDIRININP